jgi:glycosyltransferase involved in cell wall biosynthesis
MSRAAYIQYTNPAAYPPLEHSSRMLADGGWKVLFLGTDVHGIESLHFPPHANITVRKLSACRRGWRQKLHYAWFTVWAWCRTLCSGCSWAYVSDPLACPAGLLLSFAPWIRIVYHEHDSPAPGTVASHSDTSRFMRIIFWTRQKLAHRAAVCVLPNERRAEQFTRDMGPDVKVVCVWNCPTKDEVGPSRPPLNGGDLWVLYHGSLVPARLPRTVFHALGMLPEWVKLRVIGYETAGHRGYVEELRSLAATLGVSHRVEFVGTVPTRDELFAQCREADIGLAFMPKTSQDINEQAMTGASNKPFDYLACGLALLVSDLPDWRTLYVENHLALPVNPEDAASIAAALRRLSERPDELRTMGKRGRQRILAEWNYEKQFRPVFELFNGKAI